MTPDLRPLWAWMAEREAIRLRKGVLERTQRINQQGGGLMVRSTAEDEAWGEKPAMQHPSWTLDRLTDDPILQQYRFCNVRREDDRVTRWIHEHIRVPFAEHEHLWFMLAVARTINWPPTLADLIHNHEDGATAAARPSDAGFEPRHMTSVLQARKDAGMKVYTGAYMIRAESDPRQPWYGWSKQRYIAEEVLGRLWQMRGNWEAMLRAGPTMQDVWTYFQDPYYIGWGPFMAYQVVVDLRHTRYLRDAPDINTWAALGPGSRRGLNRLGGWAVDAPLSQAHGLEQMLEVRAETLAAEAAGHLAPWLTTPELSDIQNCLCEYDNYSRVKNGEGRPRALYVPGRGS